MRLEATFSIMTREEIKRMQEAGPCVSLHSFIMTYNLFGPTVFAFIVFTKFSVHTWCQNKPSIFYSIIFIYTLFSKIMMYL